MATYASYITTGDNMVKLKLDQKWLAERFKVLDENIKYQVKESFDHIACGMISDQIKEAMMKELKKPEYKEAIQKAVKELLLDQQAKQLVASFIQRRY